MKLRNLLVIPIALSLLLVHLSGCTSTAPAPTVDGTEPSAQAAQPEQPEAPSSQTLSPSVNETNDTSDIPDQAGFSADTEVDTSKLSGVVISYPLQYGDDATVTFWTEFFPGFEMYGLKDFNDLPTLPHIKEKTGIRYQFICVSEASKNEQFGLMLAGGDWPDVFMVNDYYTGGLGQAYEDEIIRDLTGLLPLHAPDYWNYIQSTNQTTLDAIMTDGMHLQMCSLRDAVYSDGGYMLRRDWLDDLGISLGDAVTLDEVKNILYAFRDNYGCANTLYVLKTGAIPGAAAFDTTEFNISNATGISCYKNGDTVVCNLQTEEYRSFLEYFTQLYQDGIINKDFYALDLSITQVYGQIGGGDMGVWNGFADTINEGAKYTDDPDWASAPLPIIVNDEGVIKFGSDTAYANTKGFQISSQCKNPGMVLEFFNWFSTEEGYEFANYGIEGETYNVDQNGIVSYTDKIANNPDVPNFMMALQIYTFNKAPALEIQSKLWGLYEPETIAAIKLWSDKTRVTSDCTMPTGAALNTEETNAIRNHVADIIAYASEALLKFMTGAETLSDENWSRFTNTCNDLGLDKCVAVYQNAYDEYKAGTRVIAAAADDRPPPPPGGGPPPGN